MHRVGRYWLALPIMLVAAWFLPAAGRPAGVTRDAAAAVWRVCDGAPWLGSSTCHRKPLHDVDPQGRMLWLATDVELEETIGQPPAVFVSAYASSAVYWDGKLIGANGRPSDEPGREKPGLRDAAFPIDDASPGTHRLALQMSSHHGLIRLRSPVTNVLVAPFERAASNVMRAYLPALITSGALLAMVTAFSIIAWGGQRRTSGRYLLAGALFATAQLGAETSRAFIELPYPLLFLRIGLVLVFGTGFGFMLLAYLARRFDLRRVWPVLAVQASFTICAIVLAPSFDQKTGLVLASALAIGMLITIRAATKSARDARTLLAMLTLGLFLSLADPYRFLDRDFYLWTASLFLLLILSEARQAKSSRTPAGEQAAEPAPKREAPAAIALGTASGRHFVLPSDIVRLAAADDYTEAFLTGARSVLHPEPLQRLLERLPPEFVRVHRSHAINLTHLRSFSKGRTSTVVLTDDMIAPVSRRSVPRLVAALES